MKKFLKLVFWFFFTKAIVMLALVHLPYESYANKLLNNYLTKKYSDNFRLYIELDSKKNFILKNLYYQNQYFRLQAEQIYVTYNLFSILRLKLNNINASNITWEFFNQADSHNNTDNEGSFLAISFIPVNSLDFKNINISISNEKFLINHIKYSNGEFHLKSLTNLAHKTIISHYDLDGSILLKKNKLLADLTLHNHGNTFVVNFNSNIHFLNGKGTIDFASNEIIFMENELQPEAISSRFLDFFKKTSGKVAFNGKILLLNNINPKISLNINLENFSSVIANSYIQNANGKLAFSNLIPMETIGTQIITIDNILNPILLDKGKIAFNAKDSLINIENISFDFGKGNLKATNSIIDLNNLNNTQVEAVVTDANLSSLVPFSEQEFYSDAIITGKILLGINNNNLVIKDGHLASSNEGVIKYKPQHFPYHDPSIQRLLKLLENFHYEFLEFDVSKVINDKIKLKVTTYGKNPELKDEKPLKFNLSLTGNLIDILRKSIQTYNLPDTLMEKITHEAAN